MCLARTCSTRLFFAITVWTFTYGSSGGTLDFNLVKEIKPDIVLVQFAERYLHLAPLKPVGFDQQ